MKKLFILLFIIFANTVHGTTELDQQMKHLSGRVRLYLRCLRPSTCSAEERKAAGENILYDGGKLLLAIGSLIVVKKYLLPPLARDLQKRLRKPTQKKEVEKITSPVISPIIEKVQNDFENAFIEEKNNPDFLGFEIESKIGGEIDLSDRYKGDPATIVYCFVPSDENNWIIVKAFFTSFAKAKEFNLKKVINITPSGNTSLGFIPKEMYKERDPQIREGSDKYPQELVQLLSKK